MREEAERIAAKLGFAGRVVFEEHTTSESDLLGVTIPLYALGYRDFRVRLYPTNIERLAKRDGIDDALERVVRHELSHAAHFQSMAWRIEPLAERMSSGPLAQRRALACLRLMHGEHSAHGAEWRKCARRLGARPRASVW